MRDPVRTSQTERSWCKRSGVHGPTGAAHETAGVGRSGRTRLPAPSHTDGWACGGQTGEAGQLKRTDEGSAECSSREAAVSSTELLGSSKQWRRMLTDIRGRCRVKPRQALFRQQPDGSGRRVVRFTQRPRGVSGASRRRLGVLHIFGRPNRLPSDIGLLLSGASSACRLVIDGPVIADDDAVVIERGGA